MAACIFHVTPSVLARCCTHKAFCLQADGRDLLQISYLLSPLFDLCPCFVPAAVGAFVTPGLICLVRKLCEGSILDDRSAICKALQPALKCIEQLMLADKEDFRVVWESALDMGIVPVLIDLLSLGHGPTSVRSLRISGLLLLVPPPEAKAVEWRQGLVRAVARLLTANPPVALKNAAKLLYLTASTCPELIGDWRTWGIEESVQQLSVHSDPAIAAAADELRKVLFCCDQDPDVSSNLACTLSSPSATLVLRSGGETLYADSIACWWFTTDKLLFPSPIGYFVWTALEIKC
jgi:hypothetical protein